LKLKNDFWRIPYNELTSCNLLHEDIEGYPATIFNIKIDRDLDFSKRNELDIRF
jgi:hypothetical protein